MAKKKVKLKMDLDSSFKIAVLAERTDKLAAELANGSACLSITIAYSDDVDYMMSIYADHFTSGEMKISSNQNGFSDVSIKGEVLRDLDPSFDVDFIMALKDRTKIEIRCSDVCDNDINNYYIDGNDKLSKIIGYCYLA